MPATRRPAAPLSAPKPLAQRIAAILPGLSRVQKQLAEYVLAHPFRVATMTIDEFAGAAGVSIASANRFARAMDLPGYPQFRAELARGFEAALAPVERLREELTHDSTCADIFQASLAEDAHNAEMTRRANRPETCEAAVRLILDAGRIQIIGFGASGFLAGLLQRGLYPYCPWVESLASPGGVSQAARQMSRVGPRDLVISIAFPRYLADTVALTRAAREAGACVMALTDTPASPLVPLARVALYAHADRQFTANADTAVMGLIEALCSAVAYQCKNAVQEATNLTESVMPWLTYGASDGDGARALRAHGQTQPRRTPRAPAPSSRKI